MTYKHGRRRPLLLDLYCGEGGAALGYFQAGFDILGVDKHPQPKYPYAFIKADVLELGLHLADFDAVHASPPCQAHSPLRAMWVWDRPDLIPQTRALLGQYKGPSVIENVPGSNLRDSVTYCGAAMGCYVDRPAKLVLRRHRLFAPSNFTLVAPECQCARFKRNGYDILTVMGGTKNNPRMPSHQWDTIATRRRVMHLPHATSYGLSQSIPPPYTYDIGRQMMRHLNQHG